MVGLLLLSVLFLLLIAVSDFRTREIPVLFLLAAFLLSAGIRYLLVGKELFWEGPVNLVAIGLQVFVLWAWIRFGKKNTGELFSGFGPADVVMLIIIGVNFTLAGYLVFISLASFLTLLVWIIVTKVRKSGEASVPFAGFLAIGLIIYQFSLLWTGAKGDWVDQYIGKVIYGLSGSF
ncbi:hypothetical protein PbJCM13498_30840 [Prolixibacter bellariivorans]|uniref:Prepilin type IV endopeptidase peptidase domain-containing protein n=1 Tax=Prolixibacter bellariivorans TaxID=314319 RepID=A0A5M4B2P9_9BACT|nr:prepilin peptidase [Prolixibacter bellariivorans]GET34221.1 hypothetical protein PbJCM13498_30840 [Prolixibacter bellariivorans]